MTNAPRRPARPMTPAVQPVGPLHRLEYVAELLDVSVKTVRRLIERGELVPHRINRGLRISEAELRKYLARCQQG